MTWPSIRTAPHPWNFGDFSRRRDVVQTTPTLFGSASGIERRTAALAGWRAHPRAAGQDDSLLLWRLDSDSPPSLVRGGGRSGGAIDWSPDGKWLAASAGTSVEIWHTTTWTLECNLPINNGVGDVARQRSGTRLAIVSWDSKLRIWESTQWNADSLATEFAWENRRAAWSPDGSRLALVGRISQVSVRDSGGRESHAIGTPTRAMTGGQWSPGRRLVLPCWDGVLRLLDADSRALVASTPVGTPLLAGVWSPDGARIATYGYDGMVRLWDSRARPVGSLQASRAGYAIAWNRPNMLITADDRDRTQIGDLTTNMAQTLARPLRRASSISVGESSLGLALADRSNIVRTWSLPGTQATEIAVTGGSVTSLAWQPRNETLAATSRLNVLLMHADGKILHTMSGQCAPTTCVAWRPDGTWLASASQDRTVRMWNAAGGFMRGMRGQAPPLDHVVWSPDGHRLAAWSEQSALVVWEAATGEPSNTFALLPGDRILGAYPRTSNTAEGGRATARFSDGL